MKPEVYWVLNGGKVRLSRLIYLPLTMSAVSLIISKIPSFYDADDQFILRLVAAMNYAVFSLLVIKIVYLRRRFISQHRDESQGSDMP